MFDNLRHKRRSRDEVFDELFRSKYPSLYRYAYSLLNDAEDSKDVVSEVFIYLLEKRADCDSITTGYLMTMVHSKALDLLRHRQVEDEARQTMLNEYATLLLPDGNREERLNAILHFVETELTPQSRKILQLCYEEKMSYKQVAQELDISTQAVNKHISQSLKKLRERFNPKQ